tara:strand:- start:1600 stop:1824 length:225 start_codon:yes stop_codon:yes gene_type:complete
MIFNKTLHSWAFLLESEYNPDDITLSHYEVNTVVISDSGVKYRNLEWLGEILPELAAWDVFQDAHESSEFLRRN